MRNSRERMMTERRRLGKLRKQLQEERVKARDLGAQYTSEVRRGVINSKECDLALLFELQQEYQEAQDKVGGLEEDYQSQERSYDSMECKFSRDEHEFYSTLIEDLYDIGIIPLSPNSYRPNPSRAATPPNFSSFKLRQSPVNEAAGLDPEETFNSSIFFPLAPSDICSHEDIPERLEITSAAHEDAIIGDEIDRYTDRLSKMVQETAFLDTPGMPIERIASESALIDTLKTYERSKLKFKKPDRSRPRSENDLAQIRPLFPTFRVKVSQWILDSLSISSFEKALAKAQLESEDTDNRTWWLMVKRLWKEDGKAVDSDVSDFGYLSEAETGRHQRIDSVNQINV